MDQCARTLLAKRVRILRVAHGWSQEVLAELSGLHRNYIGYIERAERNITLDNIEKVARAFGIPVRDLLDLPDPSIPDKPLFPRKPKTEKNGV